MKKSSWLLLICGGSLSLLLLVVAVGYLFRFVLLERLYTREGKAYMAQKKYAQAAETYTKLAEISPKSLTAYVGRADAYYHEGRFADSIADWNLAIPLAHLNESRAASYAARAACFNAEYRWEAAINDCGSALVYDPQHWSAYRMRGYAYAKIRRFDEALRDADEAIRLHQSASVYYTRGFVYGEMGQRAKALADCITATEREPKSYSAWGCLGWEQYKAGQLPEAENSERKALELNQTYPTPRFNLGLCFSVQNNAAEAKKEYALALANSKAGPRNAALIELKKAQAEHPNTPAIRESLALFAAVNPNVKSNAPQSKAQNESRSENAE